MTMLLPYFIASIQQNLSTDEVEKRIKEFGSYQPVDFNVTTMRREDYRRIRFSTKNVDFLRRNSFMPEVCIDTTGVNENAQLRIRLELAKSVEVFLVILDALVIAFEAMILVLNARNHLEQQVIIWLPAAILVIVNCLSYVCFFFSAKKVLGTVSGWIRGSSNIATTKLKLEWTPRVGLLKERGKSLH